MESVVTALCNIMKMNQGQIAELRRKRGLGGDKSDKKGLFGYLPKSMVVQSSCIVSYNPYTCGLTDSLIRKG